MPASISLIKAIVLGPSLHIHHNPIPRPLLLCPIQRLIKPVKGIHLRITLDRMLMTKLQHLINLPNGPNITPRYGHPIPIHPLHINLKLSRQ